MYQCIVANEWEQIQSTAELQLGDATPELLYWFSEQTLQPGPTVSLKCVATGNPPPQFTWNLDGFPVSSFLLLKMLLLYIYLKIKNSKIIIDLLEFRLNVYRKVLSNKYIKFY